MAKPVIIEDYNPDWPEQFETLRQRLAEALGDIAVGIVHVGSTAVPGLAAKPIIDINIAIASRADLPEAIRRLAAIGYRHEGDLGVLDREAFDAPPGPIVHHTYVCSAQSSALRRHILFRDFLRAHPADMQAYAELKRDSARRFRDDRNGYTESKTAFVLAILERAGNRWKGSPLG